MQYEVKPVGNYFGELLEIGTDVSAKKQTPYIYFSYKITHETDGAGEPVECPKPFRKEIKWYLSEGAWDMTSERLKLIEFNGNFQDPKIGDAFLACWLNCNHRVVGEEVYEEWTFDGIQTEREREPLANEVLKRLSMRYKNSTLASKSPTGKPPKPTATRAKQEPVEGPDEVPDMTDPDPQPGKKSPPKRQAVAPPEDDEVPF